MIPLTLTCHRTGKESATREHEYWIHLSTYWLTPTYEMSLYQTHTFKKKTGACHEKLYLYIIPLNPFLTN